MCVSNPLSLKSFHEILAGNVYECLLKSSIGKVSKLLCEWRCNPEIGRKLSRMGRSVGEIITTVDTLVKKHIRLIAIKEGIRLERQQNLQTKVMGTLFACLLRSSGG
jgi:hypothetical protein